MSTIDCGIEAQKQELLTQLTRIAYLAGKRILTFDAMAVEKHTKKDNTIVTRADIEAEKIICAELESLLPDYPIIAEENTSGGNLAVTQQSQLTNFFLIDPLDGTRGYLSGQKEYTVNIALLHQLKPYMGVIYAPALDLAYSGIYDAKNNISLVIKEQNNATQVTVLEELKTDKKSRIAIASALHSDSQTGHFLHEHNIKQEFSMGSSLKFCYIADGRADIYPRLGRVMEWDTAAGHAILQAVGGRVISPLTQEELTYGKIEQGFEHKNFIALAPHMQIFTK